MKMNLIERALVDPGFGLTEPPENRTGLFLDPGIELTFINERLDFSKSAVMMGGGLSCSDPKVDSLIGLIK